MSARRVTVAIPTYRRLDYLAGALRCVAAQTHPAIDLVVSDNGCNDDKVEAIVRASYHRPYRFRQNPRTVPSAIHFNQLIDAAHGDYFVLLSDDDEISPNYVASLAALLDADPRAGMALSAQEIIDRNGVVTGRSRSPLPARLEGVDFVHAAWRTYAYGFECFVTHMARTEDLRRIGGFPEFTGATHDDDAVVLRLSLGHSVVFTEDCTFRWRRYDESLGWSIGLDELAQASREFLAFLATDPTLRAFAACDPAGWQRARADVEAMVYDTYFWRWKTHYRDRLPLARWLAAVRSLPPNLRYYRRVVRELVHTTRHALFRPAGAARERG